MDHDHHHHNDHTHHHGNSHGHHHDVAPDRLGIAFLLNFCFTIIELIGGWLTQSTAIMADAVHDLGDSLALGSAWLLQRLGKRSKATLTFTYGLKRASLFSALLNAIILIIASIWVLSEAIHRLQNPIMPVTEGMFALALLGISVNGYAAYKLHGGESLNEKVMNWHLLEDVLGWVAVLIVSVVLYFFDWPILDPLLSIAFTLFILINVVRMLWATGRLFFQATPNRKLLHDIQTALLALPQTQGLHHLHLWSLDGEHHVLTAHVVVGNDLSIDDYQVVKTQLHAALAQFRLAHTTIEIELDNENCRDDGHHQDTRHPGVNS
ncbi:cation diffusion facilitator family transporter [Pusillimonas sp. NJUB218]|uniref:cation diffusion facilitator family transporter n=1 Tax=Pusillimonas sp. NJUB218 TaxID=2023230 RepID=UPI000F4BA489|nr:cation diffusion facilitator family transporter [Pusillimonas sp. NJUB218]ROT44846.1 cation transporter [Pusillimonas sp. NJUB218]